MAEDDGKQSDCVPDSEFPEVADAVFDTLADESRRLILYYLRDRLSAGLDELATVVSGWRRARTPGIGVVTPDDREEVRIELHHVHLPRLDDAGFLDYDPETKDATVATTPGFLDTILDRSLSDERRAAERRLPVGADRETERDRDVDDPWPRADGRQATESSRVEYTSLRAFLDEMVGRRRTIRVYAPEDDDTLGEYVESRGVTVEYDLLPDDGSGGFVVVTVGEEFVGSVPQRVGRELRSPEIPNLDSEPNEAIRLLMALLTDTTFVSLDRRQLLAASREIEDRAYRRGRGTFRAGFQSLSKLKAQQAVYDTLVSETDLDVHLYGRPDWEPAFPAATIHVADDSEIGRFWFVVFDGGGDDTQASALLAEESADEPGVFRGFWTYDSGLVADLDDYLDATY